MNSIAVALFAYGIGSISFAVVVSHCFGLPDPRTYGSHNPGATNVLRSGKKVAAALTLLGDGVKGWLAVWLVAQLPLWLPGLIPWPPSPLHLAVAGGAVVLGHMWPLWFRFQGGKGVATALGVLLAAHWGLGLGCLMVWLSMALVFRVSSLAALTAASVSPLLAAYLLGWRNPWFPSVGLIAVLLIARHQQNIRNLLAGKESRIGGKP